MAKSNWSGSAGWETINDPTGKLNGRALIATAGITATNEDYLMQVVGTTLAGTTFSYDNYMVSINYAWSSGAQTSIFSGGIESYCSSWETQHSHRRLSGSRLLLGSASTIKKPKLRS